ncbi:MAG: hypothetical protein A2Y80_01775 [Deltaproteobacteria bacterium RBG_13_58_19]|nr:MAG: hypothetical protein A2Y80_01775 [Deltaproteobacteria bacterium RBG_13_58_19]
MSKQIKSNCFREIHCFEGDDNTGGLNGKGNVGGFTAGVSGGLGRQKNSHCPPREKGEKRANTWVRPYAG